MRIVAPDGSTVEHFGPVTLDREEIILPATVSFCDNGGGGEAQTPVGGDEAQADAPQALTQLPATGGASLAALGTAGALILLVGGGLLAARRLFFQ